MFVIVSREINERSENESCAPSKINAQVRNREDINSACLIYFLWLNLGRILQTNPAINESIIGLKLTAISEERLFLENSLKKTKTMFRKMDKVNNTNKQSNGQH